MNTNFFTNKKSEHQKTTDKKGDAPITKHSHIDSNTKNESTSDNHISSSITFSDSQKSDSSTDSSQKSSSAPQKDSLQSDSTPSLQKKATQSSSASSSQHEQSEILESYSLNVNNVLVKVEIKRRKTHPVPKYVVSITNISDTTKLILEKIRQDFIQRVDFSSIENFESNDLQKIQDRFKKEIRSLLKKYFPELDDKTEHMLVNYIIEENLGFGKVDILLEDPQLEEIVINNHKDPVHVYHKKHGWLETNITIVTEARIRHYSAMIGRNVGKEITTLSPLMDAHLKSGDRVNATLSPISTKGNTITIRKFAKDPWTIPKFIESNTVSVDGAAFLWLCIQHELSVLVAGGTGSGKTSMLNVLANFFPANQRIISIEDTRELVLSKDLHWVPLETRLANPEGKGGVSMLDLLVNSLRMRPDRILVGEIRRKEEAQVLLEAMHTGHSVYATIHANNSEEVITRLTNPPIDLPKPMIGSLGLICVQNRNRRTGNRRTLQIAEVLPTGDPNVLLQLNVHDDLLEKLNESRVLYKRLELYTGMSVKEIQQDLLEKKKILLWMIDKGIYDIVSIGKIMSYYYLGILDIQNPPSGVKMTK
ncbi:MAG: type II/IV secretion system ATPase subunit [Candidatus Nanoarchaeia archaeon]